MRNIIIDKIHQMTELVDGFDWQLPKLKDMSNNDLLELLIEMRIEHYLEEMEL
jgi:hypothetical protein